MSDLDTTTPLQELQLMTSNLSCGPGQGDHGFQDQPTITDIIDFYCRLGTHGEANCLRQSLPLP